MAKSARNNKYFLSFRISKALKKSEEGPMIEARRANMENNRKTVIKMQGNFLIIT